MAPSKKKMIAWHDNFSNSRTQLWRTKVEIRWWSNKERNSRRSNTEWYRYNNSSSLRNSRNNRCKQQCNKIMHPRWYIRQYNRCQCKCRRHNSNSHCYSKYKIRSVPMDSEEEIRKTLLVAEVAAVVTDDSEKWNRTLKAQLRDSTTGNTAGATVLTLKATTPGDAAQITNRDTWWRKRGSIRCVAAWKLNTKRNSQAKSVEYMNK